MSPCPLQLYNFCLRLFSL